MLFGETVAVYCENHAEHTDTVRASQETHYVSTTKPNRLMLANAELVPKFHVALHASHAALPMVMLEISYCTSDFEMRGPGHPGWWSLR
jgi:hypothetical protein